MSTHENQRLSRYVFAELIECFQENIKKQIDWKRPSNTKQINTVQNTHTKYANGNITR